MFAHLLYINVLRGEDSTGVIKFDNKTVDHRKTILASPDYLRTKAGQEFLLDGKPLGFVGHTRAATLGKVTSGNAHPFSFKNVIGVHNGTVRKLFKGYEKFDTDSEGIYNLVNELGIEKALKEVASLSSAYALVWVDKTKGTLNFIRNNRRPLNFTFVLGRTSLIWSSAEEHLADVCKHNGLHPSGWNPADKGKDDKYFTLSPHDLMTLKIGEPATSATITHIDVDPDPPYPVYSGNKFYTSGGYVDGDWMDYGTGVYGNPLDEIVKGDLPSGENGYVWRQLQDGSWIKVKAKPKEKPKVVMKPKPVKFHDKGPVSSAEIAFKLTQGCAGCGTAVSAEDEWEYSRIKWWDRDNYFCAHCQEHAYVQEALNGD